MISAGIDLGSGFSKALVYGEDGQRHAQPCVASDFFLQIECVGVHEFRTNDSANPHLAVGKSWHSMMIPFNRSRLVPTCL